MVVYAWLVVPWENTTSGPEVEGGRQKRQPLGNRMGGTILAREYSPPPITAIVLYLPVFYVVSQRAWQNLLGIKSLISALIVVAVFHTWEVGHNVFQFW